MSETSEMTIILNDAGYGDERPYNALRYAIALVKKEVKVNLFLIADSVTCGLEGQDTPKGYYNIGNMIRFLVNKGMSVSACGSCMDARGIKESDFLQGVERGTMDQLAEWSMRSDDVLVW